MFRTTQLALAMLVALAVPAGADDVTQGALTISQAWVRMIIPSRPGAAYVHIQNAGDTDDRLVGAHSPKAERVGLHTHIMENNVAAMRPVDAIDVPAHGMAILAPGGDHMMMFDLDADLAEGMMVPLTLEFEHAGPIEIKAMIMRNPPEGTSMEGMDHGDDATHTEHGSD